MTNKTSLLQVKDWDTCFENSISRRGKTQRQALLPIKQSGMGYKHLLEQPNGEAMYGAFVALILRLFHQPTENRDGWLTVNGREGGVRYTPKTLAPLLNFSEKTILEMLTVVTKEIGWIVNHNSPAKYTEPYPGKIVGDKLVAVARKFHDNQKIKHPYETCFNEILRAATDYEGGKTIDRLMLEYKIPIAEIKEVLDWIPTDTFWSNTICNLNESVFNISKSNGSLKFLNAMKIMKASSDSKYLTSEQMLKRVEKDGLSTSDFEKVEINGEKRWKRKG